MSIIVDTFITMNLHEECLLKYLTNPLDLFYSTNLLKLHNDLIASEKDVQKQQKLIETTFNGRVTSVKLQV